MNLIFTTNTGNNKINLPTASHAKLSGSIPEEDGWGLTGWSGYDATIIITTRAPIQYKDDILPV